MSLESVLFDESKWHIEHGDCLEVLRSMPNESVQCCVTSPPYWGLRDYGIDGQLGLEQTPQEYVSKMVEVFREVWRVLRSDGTLWLNLGDSYAGGGRNSGNSKPHPKAYKGLEYLGDTVKPEIPDGLKQKDLVGIPWRVAFALQANGWYLRSDIIWSKPNAMPESVTDRPTKAHEYIFLLSKSPRYYYDHESIKEDAVEGDPTSPRGSTGVIDNPLNAGRRKQDEVGKRRYTGFNDRYFSQPPLEKRNKRTVWTVSTKPYAEAHFATYPSDLIEPCILAGCPEGGVVLDPFNGAGTTGLVATRLNRRYVGIELNPDYAEMAKRRIFDDAPLLNMVTP